jgi:hypothetical protein
VNLLIVATVKSLGWVLIHGRLLFFLQSIIASV